MKKYFYWIGPAVLLVALILATGKSGVDEEQAPPQTLRPTDFAAVGTIAALSPVSSQTIMQISYPENGAIVTTELRLDELSVCGGTGGALPCIAISANWDLPFGGKRVLVEGVREGGGVLLRKLWVLGENDLLYQDISGIILPENPGDVFVAWPEAVRIIENCGAKMIIQTHQLDVYVTLADGNKLRAVEPVIDEVFRITNSAMEKCGSFPIATE